MFAGAIQDAKIGAGHLDINRVRVECGFAGDRNTAFIPTKIGRAKRSQVGNFLEKLARQTAEFVLVGFVVAALRETEARRRSSAGFMPTSAAPALP